jgi:hypothetical protein
MAKLAGGGGAEDDQRTGGQGRRSFEVQPNKAANVAIRRNVNDSKGLRRKQSE